MQGVFLVAPAAVHSARTRHFEVGVDLSFTPFASATTVGGQRFPHQARAVRIPVGHVSRKQSGRGGLVLSAYVNF